MNSDKCIKLNESQRRLIDYNEEMRRLNTEMDIIYNKIQTLGYIINKLKDNMSMKEIIEINNT